MKDSVVVSGVGLICPLGQGASVVWPRMLAGEAVAEPIPEHWLYYADYRSRAWAPLGQMDFAQAGLGKSDLLRYDKVSMLAICACREALADAGFALEPGEGKSQALSIGGVDGNRAGVYIGTGIGGINTALKTHLYHAVNRVHGELSRLADGDAAALLAKVPLERRFNPLAVTMLMSNAVAAAPAVRFGITGPCRTVTLACASGTAAIAEGYRAVSRGEVDVALAGAAEYLYDDFGSIFRTYDITGALSHGIEPAHRANRPFDRERSGFLFSEGGAAIVVLERASSARSRGVTPLARISGAAETFDGHNLIAMDPSGAQLQRMLTAALAEAGLGPADVDYVNAHGTGTVMNDEIELAALARTFGERTLINSTKGLIGHTIGASGAIEAVVTALSVRDGAVHPCNNLDDPIARLNFPLEATHAPIRVALSQSFAFGGHNACLVLEQAA